MRKTKKQREGSQEIKNDSDPISKAAEVQAQEERLKKESKTISLTEKRATKLREIDSSMPFNAFA